LVRDASANESSVNSWLQQSSERGATAALPGLTRQSINFEKTFANQIDHSKSDYPISSILDAQVG
jgi:hypothetical protein